MTEAVVHLIDDDEAVRDSLAFLLTTAGIASRTYESAVTFLDQLESAAAGCVVTDIRMPEMNGLDLVRELTRRGVPHPVIVITGHADVALAVEAMKAGVVDFIEKPFAEEALLRAVRGALARVEDQVQRSREYEDIRLRIAQLTRREREVFDAVAQGHSNKEAARQLGISPRTVEIYRANVMTKMKAETLSDLVRMALQEGAAGRH